MDHLVRNFQHGGSLDFFRPIKLTIEKGRFRVHLNGGNLMVGQGAKNRNELATVLTQLMDSNVLERRSESAPNHLFGEGFELLNQTLQVPRKSGPASHLIITVDPALIQSNPEVNKWMNSVRGLVALAVKPTSLRRLATVLPPIPPLRESVR